MCRDLGGGANVTARPMMFASALAAFLALFFAVSMHAAEPNDKGSWLIGTWSGSGLPLVSSDRRATVAALPENEQPRMTITYSDDQTFSMAFGVVGRKGLATGTWEVIDDRDKTLKVRAVGSQGKNKSTLEFKHLDNDTITMQSSSQPATLTLRKVKERSEPQPIVKDQQAISHVASLRIDKSKQFHYSLPIGWEVVNHPSFSHDSFMWPHLDGKNRNVTIFDEAWKGPLEDLKDSHEQRLAETLKEFKLVESKIVTLPNKRRTIRIVNTNSNPGVSIRQMNYIIDVGKKRYVVICTVMADDGDAHDKAFESFVNSIASPTR